jgi:hypothetical protein
MAIDIDDLATPPGTSKTLPARASVYTESSTTHIRQLPDGSVGLVIDFLNPALGT